MNITAANVFEDDEALYSRKNTLILYFISMTFAVSSSTRYLGGLNIEGIDHRIISTIGLLLCGSFSFLILRFNVEYLISSLILSLYTLLSILQNDFIQVLPTAARYLLYLNMFFIGVQMGPETYKVANKYIKNGMYFFLYLIIISIALQFLTESAIFKNSANRYSGYYGEYASGFSLLASLVTIYFATRKDMPFMQKFGIVLILCFVIGLSETRAIFVGTVALSSYAFYIQSQSKHKIFILVSMVVSLLFVTYAVLSGQMLSRMSILFSGDDTSAMFRLFITNVVFSNFRSDDIYFGIGIGGFNEYFYSLTGFENIAVHNDLLLFVVEAGILGIIFYIYFFLLMPLFRVIIAFLSEDKRDIGGVIIFIGGGALSFLHNPLYYYQSFMFAVLLYGMYCGNNKERRPLEHFPTSLNR